MSISLEPRPQLETSPTAEVAEIDPRLKSELSALGRISILRATILDYVQSSFFLEGLSDQGRTMNFHGLSAKVGEDGFVTKISRLVTIAPDAHNPEAEVRVITAHTSDEKLQRLPITSTPNAHARMRLEKTRRPLIQAGLQGEAADHAVVMVRDQEYTYSLNGEVKGAPEGDELRPLNTEELEVAADSQLLAIVQAGFARLNNPRSHRSFACDVLLRKTV